MQTAPLNTLENVLTTTRKRTQGQTQDLENSLTTTLQDLLNQARLNIQLLTSGTIQAQTQVILTLQTLQLLSSIQEELEESIQALLTTI